MLPPPPWYGDESDAVDGGGDAMPLPYAGFGNGSALLNIWDEGAPTVLPVGGGGSDSMLLPYAWYDDGSAPPCIGNGDPPSTWNGDPPSTWNGDPALFPSV